MAKPKMITGSQIGTTVARLIDQHPHIKTQTGLAAATGIAQSTIGRIIRGESMPSADYAQRIASALGADVRTIYGETIAPAIAPISAPLKTWEHKTELPPGDFALLRKLTVKIDLIQGTQVAKISMDESSQTQVFRAAWIRRLGSPPDKLAYMIKAGQSMEPRIYEGDELAVDTSQQDIVDGHVYALWYNGGERVKRLYRLPSGGLRIKSDNASFDPVDVSPEHAANICILGRVVHISGGGGL